MRNEKFTTALDRYTEVSANIDFRRLVRVLWSRWYWVVVAVALALAACYAFLRFSTPRYMASVTLRYSQKKSELDKLGELVQPEGFNNDEYLTEKYVIESEEVINGAIQGLNNPFTFYRQHTFRRENVYPLLPFTGKIVAYDPVEFKNGLFEITQNGAVLYSFKDENDEEQEKKFDISKDTLITVPGLSFKINSVKSLNEDYKFVFNDIDAIKKAIDDKIIVSEPERGLPILEISFSHYNKRFTQDFLENLVKSYQNYNLRQKQGSSDLTIKFIREQISIYSKALKNASSTVQNYKQQSAIPNLESSVTEVTNKMAELETQKSTLEIEKSYISLIESSLANRNETIDIGNVGFDMKTDAVLVKMIADLNEALAKRKDLLNKRLNIKSEEIQTLDSEIERIRNQVLSNIRVQRQKNDNTIQILSNNLQAMRGRMSNLPAVERQLGYLETEKDVNQKIYLLLLNKEIEASITRAGILPSFTILTHNDAYKTYPQAIQVLLLCLLLGLGSGIGLIFLARYLNNTFNEVTKIGQNEQVNLLGIINRYPDTVQNNESDLSKFLDNRSLFAESINNIRTNLTYLAGEAVSNKGKLLVITSEISGEGKSFVTVNLATSLTKINKRVLIIVSDLRRSKLHLFFNNNNKVGLSSYLSGKVDDRKKVVQKSVIDGLDFIPAGPVPFNPAELIQNPKFGETIDAFQQEYDYVIVDTAPIGLVSDNVLLLSKSDLSIFIIRWLYSSKEAYMLPDQVTAEYNLTNVGVIVNDFYKDDLFASLAPASYYASRGYGNYYKYSYDYYGKPNKYYTDSEIDTQGFWSKIKMSFKKIIETIVKK
jgi:tyrosine-protein kinase Etk/Wzc